MKVYVYTQDDLGLEEMHCHSGMWCVEEWLPEVINRLPAATLKASEANLFVVKSMSVTFLKEANLFGRPGMKRATAHNEEILHRLRGKFPYWNRSNGRDHAWILPYSIPPPPRWHNIPRYPLAFKWRSKYVAKMAQHCIQTGFDNMWQKLQNIAFRRDSTLHSDEIRQLAALKITSGGDTSAHSRYLPSWP